MKISKSEQDLFLRNQKQDDMNVYHGHDIKAFHPRTRLFSISQSVSRGHAFVIVINRCVS